MTFQFPYLESGLFRINIIHVMYFYKSQVANINIRYSDI